MFRALLIALVLLSIGFPAMAQTSDAPKFPFEITAQPQVAKNAAPAAKRIDQVWRLPNGLEEYYLLLGMTTADKAWCDRISLEAQVRKSNARPGVQVIGWRDICLIEVANAQKNKELCRFVRGTTVDVLDGREFNENYCLEYMSSKSVGGLFSTDANHWLQVDPFKPKFLNAQAALKFLGFTDADLITTQQQGLYQTVTKASWEEFLLQRMLNPDMRKWVDPDKFNRLITRSLALPDYSKSPQPVDRFLRYTGTAVKTPADCYENPTSEFTCRMLECLSVRDIITCRAMGNTKEVLALRELFVEKCIAKHTNKSTGATNYFGPCRAEIDAPYNKIFKGAPETFLPYLDRRQ